jgi:predicted  nucleic acid-binding Zn-ribbon protein
VATKAQVDQQQELLKDQTAQLEELEDRIPELETEAGKLRGDIARLMNQLTGIEDDFSRVSSEYSALQADSEALRANNAEISKQNDLIQSRNIELEGDNLELERTIEKLGGEIETLTARASELQKNLDAATTEFEEELKRRNADLTKVNSDLLEAQKAFDGISDELERVELDLDMARQQLFKSNSLHRTSPLMMRIGDELTRLSVGPNLTTQQAGQQVYEALFAASRYARTRGAAPVSGTEEDYAAFIDIPYADGTLSGQNQVRAVIQGLSGSRDHQLLVFRALFTSFAGEPVPVKAEIVSNRVVYREGEIISEIKLDGSLGSDAIAQALEDFLQIEVRKQVLTDGLIPAIGKDLSVGELSREDVISLIEEIVAADGIVRVQFMAKEQTRAGDQVALGFRVR